MPTDFFGRVMAVFSRYGVSMIQGAGVSLQIALVGTIAGCVIGFAVGIVQTIPSEKGDNPIKRGILDREAYFKYICGVFQRYSHDGSGHVYLLWTDAPVKYQQLYFKCRLFYPFH